MSIMAFTSFGSSESPRMVSTSLNTASALLTVEQVAHVECGLGGFAQAIRECYRNRREAAERVVAFGVERIVKVEKKGGDWHRKKARPGFSQSAILLQSRSSGDEHGFIVSQHGDVIAEAQRSDARLAAKLFHENPLREVGARVD